MKNVIMFSITLMLNQLRGGKRRSLEVILEIPPRAVFFFFKVPAKARQPDL